MTPGWTNLIEMRMNALGLSQSQLAVLSGISQTRISPFLAGSKRLDNTALTTIYDTLKALESLVEIIPFPLDLRQTDRVRKLLEEIKTGELGSVVIKPAAPSSLSEGM